MDIAKLLAKVKDKQKSMARHERAKALLPGKNRIRILPGWRAEETEVFFHDFGQHWVKDAAGEVQAVYVCADRTYGKPCAVCAELTRAVKATSDDDTLKVLNEAVAGKRVLVNALMLDSDEPMVPVVVALPPTVFSSVLGLFEEWGNILDASEGRDIIVTREGKGLGTKYTVSPAAKTSALPAGVLAKLTNLDEYVAQDTDEAQSRAVLAIANVAGLVPGSVAPRLSAPKTPVKDDGDMDVPAVRAPAKDIALDSELDALLEGVGS